VLEFGGVLLLQGFGASALNAVSHAAFLAWLHGSGTAPRIDHGNPTKRAVFCSAADKTHVGFRRKL
jgi:hypothetical protein